jgi:hypothetical protein
MRHGVCSVSKFSLPNAPHFQGLNVFTFKVQTLLLCLAFSIDCPSNVSFSGVPLALHVFYCPLKILQFFSFYMV